MPQCRPSQHRLSRSIRAEPTSRSRAELTFFRLRFAENCWRAAAIFRPRAQRTRTQQMGTPLKIATEADYLQAHLTAIPEESRGGNQTVHYIKRRVTSVLKKWIEYAAVPLWVSRPE